MTRQTGARRGWFTRTRQMPLAVLVVFVLACSSTEPCQRSGGGFSPDANWKVNVPAAVADSSDGADVRVIVSFDGGVTDGDEDIIEANGGTVNQVLSGFGAIFATFTASELRTLAATYDGTRITSVRVFSGIVSGGGGGRPSCGTMRGPG